MLGARPKPLKYLVVAVQSRVAVSAVRYGSAILQSPGLEFLTTDSGVPGSISGHYKKSSGSGTGSTQPREYN
jgi:hypothetical protein